jgi:hypothetical protein
MNYKGIELIEIQGKWYFEDPFLAKAHREKGTSYELQKLKAWKERNGASDTRGWNLCLGKVIHGRRHTCPNFYSGTTNPLCTASSYHGHDWFDHRRLFWSRDKQAYILTAQPYDVYLELYQGMECFAAENGLTVEISIEDAWWYPGRTPLIVWRKKEEDCDHACSE